MVFTTNFGKRKNVGLKTLYDNSNIKNQPKTYHLGYLIGPKINAGGRVGKSAFGAELLISDDQETVDCLAKELDYFNEQRKKIEFGLIQKSSASVGTLKVFTYLYHDRTVNRSFYFWNEKKNLKFFIWSFF